MRTPPSGPTAAQQGPLLTAPAALNVNTLPGMATCTGDWPGAESFRLAVDPGGIPASQGSEVPGTTMAWTGNGTAMRPITATSIAPQTQFLLFSIAPIPPPQ